MRREDRRKSDNVVNRRGEAARTVGVSAIAIYLARIVLSRFGLTGLIVLVAGFFALNAIGINLLTPGEDYASSSEADGEVDLCAAGGDTEQFMCVVLASTEDVWGQIFAEHGASYPEPTLNIFSGSVSAGRCGTATAAVGPFYCPDTQGLYLDTAFFDELSRRFGAPGDFAEAYVVAHEVGHHIQNVTGMLDEVGAARAGLTSSRQNELQVRIELQADCLAGVWAHYEGSMGGLEEGDIEEALNAANAIGDDTLQRQAGRRPVPDSFTHGSSEQRARWFRIGFDSGDMNACDTFSAARL